MYKPGHHCWQLCMQQCWWAQWQRQNECAVWPTDKVMKLLEWVLVFRKLVNIDEIQFFVPGKDTNDAISTVRQLQEKYIVANRPCYFALCQHWGRCESRTWEGPVVGIGEPWWWGIGWVRHSVHVLQTCGSIISIVSLAWEWVCIRALLLARCSSSSHRMCFLASSTLVYIDDQVLIGAPRRSGRLAWKVEGPASTWKKINSWFLVLARMSSRNLASTPVLSVTVESPKPLSSAHCTSCGFTRGAATLVNWWPTQITSAPGFVVRLGPSTAG